MRESSGVVGYRSWLVTGRGGVECLAMFERDLRPAGPGEARIRTLASPVVQDDVAARVGNRPFLPKLPFTPGYSVVGVVDDLGSGVEGLHVGDRVGALTQFGSHAEVVYWPADALVLVPDALDPAEASVIILNYLVAHQVLHRVARVKAGDRVLIVGASGGVGTALLQLGRLAGLKMYGLASRSKHVVVTAQGAIPLDYHDPDALNGLRSAEPDGLDFVFNGMGEEYFGPAMGVLGRGGVLVHYGGPQSFARFAWLIVKYGVYNVLPNGKRVEGYGTHRLGVELFKPDWSSLFRLLEDGKIDPIVAARFPLDDAREANRLVESGQAAGTVVLLGPAAL